MRELLQPKHMAGVQIRRDDFANILVVIFPMVETDIFREK